MYILVGSISQINKIYGCFCLREHLTPCIKVVAEARHNAFNVQGYCTMVKQMRHFSLSRLNVKN